VGDVVEDASPVEDVFAEKVRHLKVQFKAQGLYRSQYSFFVIQFLVLASIFSFSMWLLLNHAQSMPCFILSAMTMGLFWQQCGWLSHDFLHHAVFPKRDWNNMVGYFLGGVCQGFSVVWWKDKHNTHHAQPNVHGEDPDIDTLPLLAWSEHALESMGGMDSRSSTARTMVPHQAILFFPILAIARVSWALQSALYVTPLWSKLTSAPISAFEPIALIIHWSWYLGALSTLSPLQAIAYFLASQSFCGLFLASVFSLNHCGMTVMSIDEANQTDFYTKQILTARDISPNMITNWFCGGLNFQIEHHVRNHFF
jgi:fatty acid desaturase